MIHTTNPTSYPFIPYRLRLASSSSRVISCAEQLRAWPARAEPWTLGSLKSLQDNKMLGTVLIPEHAQERQAYLA